MLEMVCGSSCPSRPEIGVLVGVAGSVAAEEGSDVLSAVGISGDIHQSFSKERSVQIGVSGCVVVAFRCAIVLVHGPKKGKQGKQTSL